MLASMLPWTGYEGEWDAKKARFLGRIRVGIVWISEAAEDSPVPCDGQPLTDGDTEERTLSLNENVLTGEYTWFRVVSVTAVGGDGERECGTSVALEIPPADILDSAGAWIVGSERVCSKDKGLVVGSWTGIR